MVAALKDMRGSFTFLELLVLVFFFQTSSAQTDTAGQKDLADIYRKVFSDFFHGKVNSKPDKVHITAAPAAGFTLQTRFAAAFAMNFAFRNGNPGETNLSVIDLITAYTQNKQFMITMPSNIWAKRNKYNFIGDFRFYKYPQLTYGLGGNTSLKLSSLMDYYFLRLNEAALKPLGHDFYAGLGYGLDYHFNVKETANPAIRSSDYQSYGDGTSVMSTGPSFHFVHDERRNPINPLPGTYLSAVYRSNLKALGSTRNWQSLVIDARKYIRMPGRNNTLAFWTYEWFTFGKAPYLDLPSTAWDMYSNLGRGYIQSRLRGKNLVYLESEYRFSLMKNGLIGAVVFTNAQVVSDWPDNLFRTLWPAVGGGLRIKLNKNSNTNVAIDYAFGLEGSHGFFVNLGEVF